MCAIVAIGASEGGVEAIRFIASALPAKFPAAVFVVLHIGAHKSELPALLNVSGPLPAAQAKSGEPIHPGRIYVAPPDHHLVIEPGHMRLTRGPRENWTRPAIDPLFRSAAWTYGSDVLGVILTGGLNDGTAGLFEINRCGGTAIVQDPDDALNPSMPRSALQHVAVDHRSTLKDLPDLLVSLLTRRTPAASLHNATPAPPKARRKEMTADYKLDNPVAVTCPDCGGALRRIELGTLTQFCCHIGHIYTAEVMVAAQFAALETSLAAAMRSLSERGELCRQMADLTRSARQMDAADQWTAAMNEAKEHTSTLRQLLEKEWTHPSIEPPAASAG